jgi:hypothetical protein
MKIRKENPTWYIIGDTKINNQSFQKYYEQVGFDFELNWIKANGKAQTVSHAEKLLEFLAFDFLGIKNEKPLPSNEFITANFAKLEPLFDHFSITIVLDEVSHQFITNVLLQKLSNYHINQKLYHDMSMFLPPAFERPVVSSTYGRTIGEICGNIDKFTEEALKNNVAPEDALKAATALMPLAQHSKVIITASMSNWRSLLLSLSKHSSDIETRYVMMHLCRDLKMRYFGFFCDLALEATDGKLYGLDSISNEGFWKKVSVVKKP